MMTFFVAFLSICFSVAAQFSLKTGMASASVRSAMAGPISLDTLFTVMLNRYVAGGFLLYGLGAVVWLSVLSRWEVSKAYPMVGLGFLMTLIIGAMLGEQVSVVRVVGTVLICGGVFLIARS
jgi:multidrug transporter EmrE-like cation transporter